MAVEPRSCEVKMRNRRSPLLLAALGFLLAVPASGADQAKARKKLDDEYIAFTPEKFIQNVSRGEKKIVQLFLDAGMSVDAQDDKGKTALMTAAQEEDGKMLAFLLKLGANANLGDKENNTPLCRAADRGYSKNVAALIAAGADVKTVCGAWGKTALHESAEEGDVASVTALIKAGASLEARDKYSEPPLILSLKSSKADSLRALIAAGAEVNAKLKRGGTALHEAVEKGNPEMVKALIDGGAIVDARDSEGRTPLYLAAAYDRVEVIPVLLENGADPAAKNKSGETPVKVADTNRSARATDLLKGAKKADVAARPTIPPPKGAPEAGAGAVAASTDPKGDLKKLGLPFDAKTFFERIEAEDVRAIGLFLKAGFDPKTKNDQGRMALLEAVEGRHPESVKALLAGGAKPKDVDDDPQADNSTTLVMKAVDSGDAGVVRQIVEAGGNVNKFTTYRMTALMSAAYLGNAEMVQILLKAGANPNAKATTAIPMALYSAAMQGHVDVVKLLLKAGAKSGGQKKVILDATKNAEIKKLIQAAP